MIFLDIIRGRTLNQSEIESLQYCKNNSSEDAGDHSKKLEWSQIITNLIDSAFLESILPKRRVYPLISLIELCLSESSLNRPTIESLLNHLVDASKFCGVVLLNPPHLPIICTTSLETLSSSNQSNLAICDFEFGRFESAKTRWISSLSSNPSSVEITSNFNLFRWRIGEITSLEFIDIMIRHESQYFQHLTCNEQEKIKQLIENIILESRHNSSPIHHLKFISSLISPLECLNLSKHHFYFINTTLFIKTLLNTYQISYHSLPSTEKNIDELNTAQQQQQQQQYQQNYQEENNQSKNIQLFQNISLKFDPEFEGISCYQELNTVDDVDGGNNNQNNINTINNNNNQIQLTVGEKINFDSASFFVERIIGYDIYLNHTSESLIYLFLEGCWANGTDFENNIGGYSGNNFDNYGDGGNYNDGDDVSDNVSSEFEYPIESIGSKSSQSNGGDQTQTPVPSYRHYILVVGTITHSTDNIIQDQQNNDTSDYNTSTNCAIYCGGHIRLEVDVN